MFKLETEDAELGHILSSCETTLRLFGAAFMHGPNATGTLTLHGHDGRVKAIYDVWTSKWDDIV